MKCNCPVCGKVMILHEYITYHAVICVYCGITVTAPVKYMLHRIINEPKITMKNKNKDTKKNNGIDNQ